MKPRRKRAWPSPHVSLLICAVVFVLVLALHLMGALQSLSLRAYDLFMRWQAPAAATDSQIVLVRITERDIHDPSMGGWPVTDEKLAALLTILESQHPRALGLDIFRDMPVPISGEHFDKLNWVFYSNPDIICIWSFGSGTTPSVAPPPALKQFHDRLGFNDFPVDDQIDGVVRRGLLYADDGATTYESFALRLALICLRADGIRPQPDPVHPEWLRLGRTTFRPLEKRTGSYVNIDARGYQVLLDFKGPREFPSFSMGQAMSGALPPAALRNKIVIVGVDAESVKDYLPTPLKRNHRPPELQAQFVDQLLRASLKGQRPMAAWSLAPQVGWILLWCLLGGVIGWWAHSPLRFCLLIMLGIVSLMVLAWWAFLGGWWIPLIGPIVAFLPAATLVTIYRFQVETAQRTMLQQLFQKLVSADVAEVVWRNREEFLDSATGRPVPRKVTATVLFSDLRGFAAIAESMDPTQLTEWLNGYMEAITDVVIRHGGMVRHYAGDALMAVFGFPEIRTTLEQIKHDAVQAVRCALAMERELERLNASWQQRGLPSTTMRVGIHTGEVVACALGSAQRMEYTVLGDTVNIASRLETYERDSEESNSDGRCSRIVISEATHDLLGNRFLTRLMGTMTLKGKRSRVTVCRVLKETGASKVEAGYEI